MTKIVELLKDVWTFGCKGDVITLAEKELDRLKAEAAKIGVDVSDLYKEITTKAKAEAPTVESDVKAVAADVKEATDQVAADAQTAVETATAKKGGK